MGGKVGEDGEERENEVKDRKGEEGERDGGAEESARRGQRGRERARERARERESGRGRQYARARAREGEGEGEATQLPTNESKQQSSGVSIRALPARPSPRQTRGNASASSRLHRSKSVRIEYSQTRKQEKNTQIRRSHESAELSVLNPIPRS
eukprot:3891340-Pleurochrysis_carterae.AAC.1